MLNRLKKIIPLSLFDQLIFRWQQLQYGYSNFQYRKKHPGIAFPDDYTLYESYVLDYQKFIEDGELTTHEIWESVQQYLPNSPTILDWGCGPSRITRHLQKLTPSANIFASDPNIYTIVWNQKHIPGVHFKVQEAYPPLPFEDAYFDLVIGFSVLTHIASDDQQKWIDELNRITKSNGIIWITTHGNHFIKKLSKQQQQQIKSEGIYHTPFAKKGHRMMSTYHLPEKLGMLLKEKFEILEYWDGEQHPNKAGKQDLWILRKKKV